MKNYPVAAMLRITALAMAVTTCTAAMAAGYPERPINMVVPFPAGGPTDLVARVLAKQLTQQMGQTVVVDNRAGASGTIGMQYVAAAKPDGYTVLYNTSTIAITPHLYKDLGFDPRQAYAPISSTAVIPMVLMVHPSVPAKDIKGFVDYIKANPQKLDYSSAGAGNVTHLGTELILQSIGAQATHVPYRGSAPAMIDLVGGQVHFTTNTLNDSLQYIRDNRVRPLAITSAERSELLPDVPTLAETIMPGFEVGAWQGVVAPAGTPGEIVQRLNDEIRKALNSQEMTEQLKAQGAIKLGSDPKAYAEYIDSETTRWGEVIKSAGVTLN
jgi:tripartite-type tricarboxylate transporter receptor subunit TctC